MVLAPFWTVPKNPDILRNSARCPVYTLQGLPADLFVRSAAQVLSYCEDHRMLLWRRLGPIIFFSASPLLHFAYFVTLLLIGSTD